MVLVMNISVRIPSTLQQYCKVTDDIGISAEHVQGALLELMEFHPALYRSICDETGAVRPHINLFINTQWVPVHQADGLTMPLQVGDVLTIWTAVSGG